MIEAFYTNEEGRRVKTAEHLRTRKSCCKCNCLHCPFGTTVQRLGIQFVELEGDSFTKANDIRNEEIIEGFDVTKILLEKAYGKIDPFPTITQNSKDSFRLMKIKGTSCGVAQISEGKVSKVLLKSRFKDQGITDELIQVEYDKH